VPLDSRTYSSRLGLIGEEQFQAALARFNLGKFVRAEPITGGLFGQNVFVTSTQGEWVLRGTPHYDWQLPSEEFFARLLHERTNAPTPWPYLLDDSTDIFGWSYAVMPRMPGLALSDRAIASGLSKNDRIGIARAMASNLDLVHALTWDLPGQYDLTADTISPYQEAWADWVTAKVRTLLARSRHSDRTTDSDIEWVNDLLAASRNALGEAFQPGVVLRDYGEHNVSVSRSPDGWQVSGVFDLMEASFGDREMDLSRQVALYLDEDVELARTFLRQYLDLRPPRPGFTERFPVFMLRDRLIVWEYCQRPGTGSLLDPGLTLRKWAEPYVTSFQQLLENHL
jgi:aminoglycoside phosphotransferase (APT) family kinase protein